MHLLQSDYIFPITSTPVKNGIIRLKDDGTVLEVIDPETNPSPENGSIRKLKGFICPGFINSHCHLELSHLKGQIPENAGMSGFIKGIMTTRNKFSVEEIMAAMEAAEDEMIANGIVAVGDISNTNLSFNQKSKNRLHYHTFIELFDLGDESAEDVFEKGKMLLDGLKLVQPDGHTSSLVPHAPYTVSKRLFELLDNCAYENNFLLSMHNQESEGENEMFISRTGPLYDFLNDAGINLDYIEQSGNNALLTMLPRLSRCSSVMLVHNTYTTSADLAWAVKYSGGLYWCFCPRANLYIESRLPDIKNFLSQSPRLLTGTDSLASNHSLSILDELKTIASHEPDIPLNELLSWATINGAKFFNINKRFGSIEPGKKPGINLLEQVDVPKLAFTGSASVRKLF
jgi:aminodeoxyfutalosine deaminase